MCDRVWSTQVPAAKWLDDEEEDEEDEEEEEEEILTRN